jgi:predicted phosphodiesterase
MNNKWAINPGAVGRSKEKNRLASYLKLEINETEIKPEIIQIPFDKQKVIKAILNSGIPDFYAKFWEN